MPPVVHNNLEEQAKMTENTKGGPRGPPLLTDAYHSGLYVGSSDGSLEAGLAQELL
jgi:hypothetical protein